MTGLPLARRAGAEAVGTYALVTAGCGAIVVNARTEALGHVGVALTFGLVIIRILAHLLACAARTRLVVSTLTKSDHHPGRYIAHRGRKGDRMLVPFAYLRYQTGIVFCQHPGRLPRFHS